MNRPNFHTEFEQRTPEWKAYKLGRFSGSKIEDVLAVGRGGGESATRRKLIHNLANEREFKVKQESGFHSKAMDDGNEWEPIARIAYEARMGVEVDQFGFIDHRVIQWFGVSPDGVIDFKIGLEIKCPELHTHNATLLGEPVIRKYVLQMNGLMDCANLEAVDFVSFHPFYPEGDRRRLFIKRFYRDEKLIKEIRKGVIKANEEVEALIEKLRAIGDPVYLGRE